MHIFIDLLREIFLVFFLLSVFYIKANVPLTNSNEEKLIIIENIQNVEFFINKKTGQLNALLRELKVYQSKSSLPVKVNQVIIIDDNSKVESMWRKDRRRRKETKPIITDYETGGVFHNDLKLCITEHQINEKGAIVELGYEKIFTDVRFLNALYFKQIYTTENSRIEIKVPNWLELRIEQINFENNTVIDFQEIKGKEKTYIFSQKDLTKFNNEKGTPSRQKIEPHLILIPTSYQANNKKVKLTESVDDLYRWYHELVGLVDNETSILKSLVTDLIEGKTTDIEKINAIYFWVQDNIRYIAFEDGINGFKPESCQSVYKNRYGDCKGMANLAKSMLKLAGFDARLTWMGTRDIPYSYDIPSLMVDNHMICTVFLNGQKLYLDPTQKYTGIEEYGYYIQEQEVLIEDGANYIRDKIPLSQKGHYSTTTKQVLKLENNRFIGTGKISYNGSSRIRLANYLSEIEQNKKEKFLTRYISNDNKNIDLSINNLPDWIQRNQAIELDYTIELNNQVIDLGKEMYLNVEIDHEFANSDIAEDRKVPYEFSDRYQFESITEIQLPDNVTIDYLPATIDIQKEGYRFYLKYEKKNAQTILYTRRINLNVSILEVEKFETWNIDIQALKDFYEDQIIIKKR